MKIELKRNIFLSAKWKIFYHKCNSTELCVLSYSNFENQKIISCVGVYDFTSWVILFSIIYFVSIRFSCWILNSKTLPTYRYDIMYLVSCYVLNKNGFTCYFSLFWSRKTSLLFCFQIKSHRNIEETLIFLLFENKKGNTLYCST